MEEEEPPRASQLMAVVIPPNCHPGQPLNIQTPDGRLFNIIIPNGTQPGQTLTVEILEDAQGGSHVIVAEDTVTTTNAPHESNKAALGAAAVGAVIGTLLIGPITGIVVAGAALYASTRNDQIGDATRSTGSAAVSAYGKTVEAAEKYHVREKVGAATEATMKKAHEINEQYKVTEHIHSATKEIAKGAKELDQKYDITGKTVSFLQAGAKATTSALSKLTADSSSSATITATAVPAPPK